MGTRKPRISNPCTQEEFEDPGLKLSPDYLVGTGTPDAPNATSHALLWNRSTGQVTDLGTTYEGARATAISGTTIVGTGHTSVGGDSMFLFWPDPASSYQSLQGSTGYLNDINGTTIVGTFIFQSESAIVWLGPSHTSYLIDKFIPAYYPYDIEFESGASAVNAQGIIVGNYGIPRLGSSNAVVWFPTPLPEPSSLLLFIPCLFLSTTRPPLKPK